MKKISVSVSYDEEKPFASMLDISLHKMQENTFLTW